MPVPRGRPFNRYTPLGQKMYDAGLNVVDVAYATGIHHRTLSNYLAWRQPILAGHLIRLCALFQCEPGEFEPKCQVCGDKGCEECWDE